jgi:RecB family exonuclease
VTANKLPVFSASQVSTYEACPRKWAYQKIDGLTTPPHPSAAFGTQVHSHLEAWFERRELPPETDTGKVARAMIPHLPAPQQILAENVEKEFSWRFGDDIAFRGFIDLVDESVTPLTIYDHKTTGSLAYAKSVTDLLDDPQATLYARAMMDARGLDRVRLRWTYATR